MSGVVGTHCVEFPQPTEPIVYQPFFGKFATTGAGGGAERSEAQPTDTGRGEEQTGKQVGPCQARARRPAAVRRRRGPNRPAAAHTGAPSEPATPGNGSAGGRTDRHPARTDREPVGRRTAAGRRREDGGTAPPG